MNNPDYFVPEIHTEWSAFTPEDYLNYRAGGWRLDFFTKVRGMTRYLIDIRLMGSVKHQIRTLSNQLSEKFSIADKLVVPHITLAGPFSTGDEEKLIEDFSRICSDQVVPPKYELGGYGFFDDTRVVFVTITPDGNLRHFRYQLSRAISPYCSLRNYDLDDEDEFRFHATLAMKLDWLTFQRIKWYFRRQEAIIYRHHPIRATLLRNSRILCEYDFVQGRMLSRAQALSRATRMRDLAILRSWDDGGGE
jgi:2'-5' RNA ligase